MAKPSPSYSTSNTEEKKCLAERTSGKSESSNPSPFALQDSTPMIQQDSDDKSTQVITEGLTKIAA